MNSSVPLSGSMGNDSRWRVYPIHEFGEFIAPWDALNHESGSLPFLRSEFLRLALSEFGNGREFLAVCGSERVPRAMGLFTRTRYGMWTTFQPSQLPLGAFLIRQDETFDSILTGLPGALPGLALAVGITQQDPRIARRSPDSSRVATLDYIRTAHVTVSGTFDDYWAARGKNLRHNVKRQVAKLAQDGVSTRLDVIRSPEEIGSAIADYGRLESAGWKAKEGTAVNVQNVQGAFYRKMLEAYCETGSGRVYRYWFDDKVVAMDLCVENSGMLVILKTAYDESYRAISPAFLMRYEYSGRYSMRAVSNASNSSAS